VALKCFSKQAAMVKLDASYNPKVVDSGATPQPIYLFKQMGYGSIRPCDSLSFCPLSVFTAVGVIATAFLATR
jgi:hypothetical protein